MLEIEDANLSRATKSIQSSNKINPWPVESQVGGKLNTFNKSACLYFLNYKNKSMLKQTSSFFKGSGYSLSHGSFPTLGMTIM